VTQTLKDSNRLINLAAYDRRGGKRLFLTYTVEFKGVDEEGRTFIDRAKTEDISESGCRFKTKVPLRRGDRLEIKLIPPPGTDLPEQTSQPFEVMWVEEEEKGWSVGARKTTKEKIWKVSFPPPKPPHDPRSR
jgi:hypothetical protein